MVPLRGKMKNERFWNDLDRVVGRIINGYMLCVV